MKRKTLQTKTTQKKLQILRNWVSNEIKRINRSRSPSKIGNFPKFSYKIDIRTRKIILCYTIPKIDISKKKGYKKVHQYYYHKNITLDNYKKRLNVLEDYEYVVEQNNNSISNLFVDDKTLKYWIERYCSPIPRRGVDDVPNEKTLNYYRLYLTDYYNWLEENKPNFLSLWAHNSQEGVNLYIKYLIYKTENSIRKNGWSNTTINNSYRTIRAFFNWIADKNPQFKRGLYSNLRGIPKSNPLKTSFTPNEIKKVLEFMEVYKDDLRWYWFIPMLRVMLVSGCRISELVNMKINDLRFDDKRKRFRWEFTGKGRKKRNIFIDDKQCFKEIKSLITDKNNNIRTDKEYVFHRQYYKSPNPNDGSKGGGYIERKDLPYSVSGIQHKFRKMTEFLKISTSLTPHSCRRFFIMEKLRETNGDLNLVRLLVGHSSLKMILHYHDTIQEYNTLIGRRNTLDLGKVIKRNEDII